MNSAVVFGIFCAAVVAALLLIFILRRRERKPTRIHWLSIAVLAFVAGFSAMIAWAVLDHSEVAIFEDLDWEEFSLLDGETG